MFKISKKFTFSASHQLEGLPENHPCSRLHGHNYSVIVTLADKKLNKVGFVKDYRELESIKEYFDRVADHKHLNDVFDFNPTAELLAAYFYSRFKLNHPQLFSVTVKETDKTSATYEE